MIGVLSIITILSWIATTCSLTGNYYVNRKKTFGLYVWTIGSLLWVSISISTNNIPQLIMFGTYTIFNIDGIVKWRRDDNKIVKLGSPINNHNHISVFTKDEDEICYRRILPDLDILCADKYYMTSEDIYNILSYSGKILKLIKRSTINDEGVRINYYIHEESGYLFYDDMVTVEYIIDYIDFIKEMNSIIKSIKDYEYNVRIYDITSGITQKLIYRNGFFINDDMSNSVLSLSSELLNTLFIISTR